MPPTIPPIQQAVLPTAQSPTRVPEKRAHRRSKAGYAYRPELLLFQKRITDYFDYWRQGRGWDGERRQHAYEKSVFPKPGRWPGHKPTLPHARPSVIPYGGVLRAPPKNGPDASKKAAKEVALELSKSLEKAGLRSKGILGWGGLGVAALYEVTDIKGVPHKVVVKTDLGQEKVSRVKSEKDWHIALGRSQHIVQLVKLKQFGKVIEQAEPGLVKKRDNDDVDGKEEPSAKRQRATLEISASEPEVEKKKRKLKQIDKREELMVLEYLRFGNLYGALVRAASTNASFPDRVLWMIFNCLFKAVVAMKHPPRHRPERLAHAAVGPPMDETAVKMGEKAGNLNLVHFDLDPNNILIGDFDTEDHKMAPVFKAADFGLAFLPDTTSNDTYALWRLRRQGKPNWLTPEQFTDEWDYIAKNPKSSNEHTAGNFDWHTNLFGMANIMACLVTLCQPSMPPVAEKFTFSTLTGGGIEEWSYGGHLASERYSHVDPLFATCSFPA